MTSTTRGRGYLFTENETIDLIRGVNTYGLGNWTRIFNETRLCFLTNSIHRKEHLCPKWRNLKSKCLFDEYFYLPGKKEQCKALPLLASSNSSPKKSKNAIFKDGKKQFEIIKSVKIKEKKEGIRVKLKDNGVKRILIIKKIKIWE